MRFLLDENFPKSAEEILGKLGHETFDLCGSDLEGVSDSEVFEKARQLGAVLLTTDRDFFHTIPHLFPDHCGIVVVALRQPSWKGILGRLEWFLTHIPESAWSGRAFQMRDATWFAYPPLT